MEGILLRQGWTYGPNPRILAVGADVFGSFVRRCIGEISFYEVGWLVRPPHIMRKIVDRNVGKDRLSDGRRRPPAARHERLDIGEAIMWWRLRSGPVIIVGAAKRCLGEACFVRMVGSGREPPT